MSKNAWQPANDVLSGLEFIEKMSHQTHFFSFTLTQNRVRPGPLPRTLLGKFTMLFQTASDPPR